MRRGRWADDLDIIRAASNKGVIRARTLAELGIAESTIYARCRDGGPWRRLLPGIILLTNGVPTIDQKVVAALLLGGPDAIVTGLEACRRHGVRRGPRGIGEIQILVPHTRQVRTIGFVHVERTSRLPVPIVRDGVPLAPVARASIDAARRLRRRGDIAELLSDPVQQRLCTIAALDAELNECSRRGTATPRNVLAGVAAGVRSAAELDARALWASTGLPEPWWNARVCTLDGKLIGYPDAWFDEVAMAWEIDSTEWHLSPPDHNRTVAKAAAYAAAGIIHVPSQPSTMRLERQLVRQTLISAHAHAANRPRPALLVTRR
ncbi:hypothetical protein ACFPFQ_46395 [Pseudonocardia sp. GCM10023141]